MLNQLMKRFELEFIGQTKEWYPVKDTVYYGRMSDKEIEDMRARNEAAIKQCIEDMGTKWVLHPVHRVFKNVSQ